MNKFVIRDASGQYDPDALSRATGLLCEDLSLAQQSMAEDADINVIVKRFGLIGGLPENSRLPQYGDFTGIGDYGSALRAVREADEAFLEYPPELRARFDNDPQRFLEFCSDSSNQEALYDLGLADRPPSPPVDPSETPPVGPAA